jgi:hypothetical protein
VTADQAEPQLSARERVAQRLLVLANIELIADEKSKLTAEAKQLFNRPGQKEPVWLSDDPDDALGDVRRDPQRSAWKVTSDDKLVEWCEQYAPQHVVARTTYSVTPGYVEALLSDLAAGKPIEVEELDQVTGEITPRKLTEIPGIQYVTDTAVHLVVTKAKTGPDAVLRELGEAAALLGLRPAARELDAEVISATFSVIDRDAAVKP